MKMKTLNDLYIAELRDVYSAEKQILKALPKMIKAATAPELKAGFSEHLEQTKGQVARLETIFKELGTRPTGKTCKAMEGLAEEGQELIDEEPEPHVLDAGLIGAAQKVEHYEIASYGSLRTYAELLGATEAARLLQETLNEETDTDKKLSKLAKSLINVEAHSVAS